MAKMRQLKKIEDKAFVMSRRELEEQIEVREDLLKQMVGTLYTPIVTGEIERIRELIDETDTCPPQRPGYEKG